MQEPAPALLTLNPYEARTAAAVFERLFPRDEYGPGATEIGVLAFVDRALAGAYRDKSEIYRLGLKHGMRLATISGVNGVYTDEDFDRVRRLALAAGAAPQPGTHPTALATSQGGQS